MADARNTVLGVACGMGAGALWGLVFLAPELVRGFGPLQLAAGRYLAYGVLAAALLAPRWRRVFARLGRREWLALSGLGLLGNTVYYVLLASAVQLGGIAMTSLVIGFLPVLITLAGRRDAASPGLARLAPSLLMGIAGAACIGWQTALAANSGSHLREFAGLACAVGALISWACFAVGNSRWLTRLDHVSPHDWSLLLGIATGLQALLLIPLAQLLEPVGHDAPWVPFVAVSLGVGLFASVVGNALWNRMSRLLPLTLVGQMILFETLFALLYGFIWESRLPTWLEGAAILLVLGSVVLCLTAHRPRQAHAA